MNVAQAGMSSVGLSRMRFAPESDPYRWIRGAVREDYAEMSAEDLEAALAREGIDAPAMAGLAGGGGGNSAGALLNVLRTPQVLQSLMSLALGSAGRQTVPVGASQTPVPTSAVANLIGQLGSRAFAQAEAAAEPSEAL